MPIYNLLLLFVYPLLWLASRFHSRLKMNFELRKTLPDFSAAQGKMHIWFHASSAGEFEQVRAVALAMRRKNPRLFFSFSYFSDSTYRTRKNDPVPDTLFALPFDFPWRMRKLVRAMRPAALIIGKYDAWPNHVLAAARAGVPVYLVSATLPAKSRRYRFPLRYFLRSVYAPMRQIFAVNGEHAERLKKISPQNVVVSGDTRFDAIAERLKENEDKKKQLSAIAAQLKGKSVIVAGSSYEASEDMLIGFFAAQRKLGGKPLRLILAPHHLKETNILRIAQKCADSGLRARRLTQPGKAEWDVLVIDAFGLLAYLYPLADIAYIGGGFKGSVHSVIEAAIAGVPAVTGPAIANSAEALDLARAGILCVAQKADAHEFAGHVEYLWKNRHRLGASMALYFRQRLGVSGRIMHTVMDELTKKSG